MPIGFLVWPIRDRLVKVLSAEGFLSTELLLIRQVGLERTRALEEANLYTSGASSVSGLFRTKHIGAAPKAARSARRWALVALVWGVLWVWGFGSFVAIFASGFSWFEYRRAGKRPLPAVIAMGIAIVGLVIAMGIGIGVID